MSWNIRFSCVFHNLHSTALSWGNKTWIAGQRVIIWIIDRLSEKITLQRRILWGLHQTETSTNCCLNWGFVSLLSRFCVLVLSSHLPDHTTAPASYHPINFPDFVMLFCLPTLQPDSPVSKSCFLTCHICHTQPGHVILSAAWITSALHLPGHPLLRWAMLLSYSQILKFHVFFSPTVWLISGLLAHVCNGYYDV